MAFTYDLSSSTAATVILSKVRLLIPDNDSTAYELEDAEVEYFIGVNGGNINGAAADCCDQIARKFSLKPSFVADGLSVSNAERAAQFAARAAQLRAQLVGGGISVLSVSRSDGYSSVTNTGEYDRIIYTTLK